MRILGIESSCDETAASVVEDGETVLSSVVASQMSTHGKYGGVVPELASREHLRAIVPVVREALEQAGTRLQDLDAIAATVGPGLVGSLLVGLTYAKSLCFARGLPLIAVNHIEGHIHAVVMESKRAGTPVEFPAMALVVSGGHTHPFEVREGFEYRLLGKTRDDAAGEAFDKVASLLGLGFPGGPAVEREAALGNPKAYPFPRSFLNADRLEFSFSGLKTAVRYALFGPSTTRGPLPGPGPVRANLAASFQQAVIDVLVAKCRQALHKTRLPRLAVGGGVCANRPLRAALEAMAQRERVELFIPPLDLCTDNAAMAAVAVEKWHKQMWAPLDLDAVPN
jgi:N6-L-threonylcarbamoyladenine synthase